MSRVSKVEAEVEALMQLDLTSLREIWRERHGTEAAFRSRDLVRRMLAFDIQAEAYGGLDAELRQRLRRAGAAPKRKADLQPGSVITREWRGEHHKVEVVDGGFVHHGITYDSLSEVARVITGTRWSGPRFFGLVDKAAA